jgi:hypothetical protein
LPLIPTNPPEALLAFNLLINFPLSQNIVCIPYRECTSLTDASLLSPPAFATGFICCSKGPDFSCQERVLMG